MKCDVAFPIEGFTLDVIKPFSVGDVTFELHNPEVFFDPNQYLQLHQIKDIQILGIARDVAGKDTHEVKSSAYQSVDRAVNIIQFLVTDSLRTVDEVYFIKPLDNEGPVKKEDTINNGFRALHQVTKSFSLDGLFPGPRFDAQKYVEERLKSFGAIRPDRKETLEKALSHYRIALCACSPYQAIESFFGAIQAIVIVMVSGKKDPSPEIKDYMKPRIISGIPGMTENIFYQNFATFWGIYRTGGSHGRHHVNDYSKMREVSIASYEMSKWTYVIIDDYIKESSRSIF